MFSIGHAAVPARGIGEIAFQLASTLNSDDIKLDSRVIAVEERQVVLADGTKVEGDAVVVATDMKAADHLLKTKADRSFNGVTCLYFRAEKPPMMEPILMLNGSGEGVVNNVCVPSQVSKLVAPVNQALISVSVLGTHADKTTLQGQVQSELEEWFGPAVRSWGLLRQYDIPCALPSQLPGTVESAWNPKNSSLYVAGDHTAMSSIEGAMMSGRRVAEHLIHRFTSM